MLVQIRIWARKLAIARDKEYGVGGFYVGVPMGLGAAGVEQIIELQLSAGERAAFQKSVDAVKGLVETMARLAG